ncbi:MAG: hypothetical protein WCG45_01980 [bacterium]
MISLYILSFILILSFPDSQVKADCTWNGHKLYGKITYVNDFPDIKIKIVDNFPDLKVQLVDNFPNSCGKWQIVDNLPDLKVKIVTDFPDIKVKFVNDFPGIPPETGVQENNH